MGDERPAPRCGACYGPMPADLGWRYHPCCDPVHARWVHYWADVVHREHVRARADAAREALRAAQLQRSRPGGRYLAAS